MVTIYLRLPVLLNWMFFWKLLVYMTYGLWGNEIQLYKNWKATISFGSILSPRRPMKIYYHQGALWNQKTYSARRGECMCKDMHARGWCKCKEGNNCCLGHSLLYLSSKITASDDQKTVYRHTLSLSRHSVCIPKCHTQKCLKFMVCLLRTNWLSG